MITHLVHELLQSKHMIDIGDLDDYYEELETQTIEKEKKRDKKVITKMVVDGAGIKTVIINRRYKKLLEEYEF